MKLSTEDIVSLDTLECDLLAYVVQEYMKIDPAFIKCINKHKIYTVLTSLSDKLTEIGVCVKDNLIQKIFIEYTQ
jgi:hypothetical protein